jgi:hypothetical protein
MAPETLDEPSHVTGLKEGGVSENPFRETAEERSAYVICELCGQRFRAINGFHLRAAHGYEGEHPVLDYKAQFGLRYAMSGDTRERMSDARDMFWSERGQHWTEESVLAEIRRRYRAGESLRCKDIPVRLVLAARRLFGSWEAAIAKAGLRYEETAGDWRWSREKVIEIPMNTKRRAAAGIKNRPRAGYGSVPGRGCPFWHMTFPAI